MLRKILIGAVVALAVLSAGEVQARGRRPIANTMNVISNVVNSSETKTAQGVANIMARLGRVGHHGGNTSYEGCGCATTAQGAYNICCYSNMPWKTVDVGYAQGHNGMWFCCRRYSTR